MILLVLVFYSCTSTPGFADDFKRQPDVIYGCKHGMASTMDVFNSLEKFNYHGIKTGNELPKRVYEQLL